MPIRPEAARHVARGIYTAIHPDIENEVMVSLIASVIINAVDVDELRMRKQALELKLIELDGPDSLGG